MVAYKFKSNNETDDEAATDMKMIKKLPFARYNKWRKRPRRTSVTSATESAFGGGRSRKGMSSQEGRLDAAKWQKAVWRDLLGLGSLPISLQALDHKKRFKTMIFTSSYTLTLV